MARRANAADRSRETSVAIVGCGKAKAAESCAAGELYTGGLFRATFDHAKHWHRIVYIVSAKYGLLDPSSTIAPYDETLATKSPAQRAAWARKVAAELADKMRGKVWNVTIYAGADYARPLVAELEQLPHSAHGGRQHLPSPGLTTIAEPMRGLTQGRRLQWLAQQRRYRLTVDPTGTLEGKDFERALRELIPRTKPAPSSSPRRSATPASSAPRARRARRLERGGQQTMFNPKTPGTRLEWQHLGDWIDAWWELEERKASSARNEALDAHLEALPDALIEAAHDYPKNLDDAEKIARHAAKRDLTKRPTVARILNAIDRARHARRPELGELEQPTSSSAPIPVGKNAYTFIKRPMGRKGTRTELEGAARVEVLEAGPIYKVRVLQGSGIPAGRILERTRDQLYAASNRDEAAAFKLEVSRYWGGAAPAPATPAPRARRARRARPAPPPPPPRAAPPPPRARPATPAPPRTARELEQARRARAARAREAAGQGVLFNPRGRPMRARATRPNALRPSFWFGEDAEPIEHLDRIPHGPTSYGDLWIVRLPEGSRAPEAPGFYAVIQYDRLPQGGIDKVGPPRASDLSGPYDITGGPASHPDDLREDWLEIRPLVHRDADDKSPRYAVSRLGTLRGFGNPRAKKKAAKVPPKARRARAKKPPQDRARARRAPTPRARRARALEAGPPLELARKTTTHVYTVRKENAAHRSDLYNGRRRVGAGPVVNLRPNPTPLELRPRWIALRTGGKMSERARELTRGQTGVYAIREAAGGPILYIGEAHEAHPTELRRPKRKKGQRTRPPAVRRPQPLRWWKTITRHLYPWEWHYDPRDPRAEHNKRPDEWVYRGNHDLEISIWPTTPGEAKTVEGRLILEHRPKHSRKLELPAAEVDELEAAGELEEAPF